jgi:hypothetical protein
MKHPWLLSAPNDEVVANATVEEIKAEHQAEIEGWVTVALEEQARADEMTKRAFVAEHENIHITMAGARDRVLLRVAGENLLKHLEVIQLQKQVLHDFKIQMMKEK